MIEEDGAAKQEQLKLLFTELTQVCLWGNATDLSLLINVRIFIFIFYVEIPDLTGIQETR